MRTTLLLFASLLAVACPKDPPTDPPQDSPPGDTHETAPPAGDPCAELGLPVRAFVDAPEDDSLYATAADFTVPTRAGDWTLSERWTGCDTILLIQDGPKQNQGWPTGIFERDVDDLFAKLPRNTQLLFMSTATSTAAIEASLDGLQAEVDLVLAGMDEANRAWWQGRVHYATQRAQIIDGWVGDIMNNPGWGVGIDRLQRIRYIGSYADPTRYSSSYGWFEPNLSFVANEPIYYNFEAEREAVIEAQDALVVPVFDGSGWASAFETELVIPAEAADYDSLALDLHMGCGGEGEYGDCFAWDTGAALYVCAQPTQANPWTDTPCQAAVAEVMGSCSEDGVATETACRSEEDCGADTGIAYACTGYDEAVAADTQPGSCEGPLGASSDASYACNAEGTGYDELACGCDHELGRWITTYHREGRWVHEVTGLQPLLTPGATERLRFSTGSSYTVDLDLRFYDSGRGTRAQELTHLFGSCNLAGDCNATYAGGVQVEVPADAVKVQLATVITGHGMSSPGNCAEFCDMDHIFGVNGEDALTVNFDVEGPDYRCMDEVELGTVPNQYGTWWYSRHGWCPGREVPVQLHDITALVNLGAVNQLDYRVLRNGADYTGASSWADIWAAVWLVVER